MTRPQVGGTPSGFQPAPLLTDTSKPRDFIAPNDPDANSSIVLASGDKWYQAGPQFTPPPPPQQNLPFLGVAFGSNSTPTQLEAAAGRPVGVHRIYTKDSSTASRDSVISIAAADVAAHRVPWCSFTPLPDTWANAKNGSLDSYWADICARLGALPGPVMVTPYHEPEGDQSPLSDYVAMCDRLYQFAKPYPNLKYGPIMILYDELFGGSSWPTLSQLWPGQFNSGDFFGFDAYCYYLTARSGKWFYMGPTYWKPAAQFAASKGVKWAVGEFGISGAAAAYNRSITGGNSNGSSGGDVDWLREAYQSAVDLGGCLALSYFDTYINSTTNNSTTFGADINGQPAWILENQSTNSADDGTPSKFNVFADVLKQSAPWRATW